ncbi:MAG: transaldolase family protein, partial [Cycloclasticus sp.]
MVERQPSKLNVRGSSPLTRLGQKTLYTIHLFSFQGSMKIFLDTADTDTIRRYYNTGLIDGVTTNPTLIMKSGKCPTDVYQAIKDIGIKDISMEVVGDYNEMVQ